MASRCNFCGNEEELYTAPWGAMAYDSCNDMVKALNYAASLGIPGHLVAEVVTKALNEHFLTLDEESASDNAPTPNT